VPVSERAGQPASQADLVDVARLVTAYYALHPDPAVPEQRVSFGTSGHRGSALRSSFNEDHIAATSQAICDYRARAGTTGPLFLGRDTHALSEPAFVTALEVLAANDVTVLVDSRDGYTPTPALVPGHPGLERGARRRPGRRDRDHPVPQPAGGRRVQVQPARRRPGRVADHLGHPGPGQRAAGRRPARGAAASRASARSSSMLGNRNAISALRPLCGVGALSSAST